jgi:hypothetical protein
MYGHTVNDILIEGHPTGKGEWDNEYLCDMRKSSA